MASPFPLSSEPSPAPPPPEPPPHPAEPPPLPEAFRYWSIFWEGPPWTRRAEGALWLASAGAGALCLLLMAIGALPPPHVLPLPQFHPEEVLRETPAITILQWIGAALGVAVWIAWLARRCSVPKEPDAGGMMAGEGDGTPAPTNWRDPDATLIPLRDLLKIVLFTGVVGLAATAVSLFGTGPETLLLWQTPLLLWASALVGGYAWLLWKRRGGDDRVTALAADGWPETLKTAVTAFFGFFPVAWALDWLSGDKPLQEIGAWMVWAKGEPLAFGLVAVYVALVGPVVEELQFRLLVRGALRRWVSGWWLCLLNGMLFAIIHFQPDHLLPLTVMGVYWAWWRERSRGLAVPILLHVFNNAYAVAVLMLALK